MDVLRSCDPTSLITALMGAQTGMMQLAVAARLMRMNADQGAAVVKLIDAAQQNIDPLANVAAGLGNEPRRQRVTAPLSSAIAALTNFTPSSLAHSAGPAMLPISQPERSISSVVGMPKALPAVFRSSNTWALGSEK